MPQRAFDLWLDCANVDADIAAALIAPADDRLLEAHPVSPAVNRVANDSEALIAPLSAQTEQAAPAPRAKPSKAKKSDDQPTLF